MGCLSQIGQFLESYYSYGVVINLESIKQNYLTFPAVTICNINSIRQEFEPCVKQMINYHKCFGLNYTDESAIIDDNNVTLPECTYDMTSYRTQNVDKFDWIYLLMSQSFASKIKYGHQFQDLIRSCVYNGWHCKSDDFELSVSHLFGNCYTFNAGKEKYLSKQSGQMSGLEIELDLEVDKYSTFTQTVGARVEIHDSHSDHRIDRRGFFLSPGYETYIAITKSVLYRLPYPYKDHCRNYSLGDGPENCQDLCLHNITTSVCACSTIRRFHLRIRQCDFTDPLIFCCLAMVIKGKYLCDCPLFCEENVYETHLSSSFWPSRSYYEENKDTYMKTNENSVPVSFEKFRETRLRLSVFYDTLDYFIYKQSPMYQSSEIFSQIGGHMGLWLGVSVAFVFEFLENIAMFCRQIFKYFKIFTLLNSC